MILGKFCLMFGIIENVLRSTLSYPNETSKECSGKGLRHISM
jgi:hypothetical protein